MIIYVLFHRKNKPIFTKDNWDLVPATMLQQWRGNSESLRPKTLPTEGELGEQIHQLLLCSEGTHPKGTHWCQTPYGGKPDTQGIRPSDPAKHPATPLCFGQT